MIDAINAIVPMAALAGVEIRFFHAGASGPNKREYTTQMSGNASTAASSGKLLAPSGPILCVTPGVRL
jgi:hypothetical protein